MSLVGVESYILRLAFRDFVHLQRTTRAAPDLSSSRQ